MRTVNRWDMLESVVESHCCIYALLENGIYVYVGSSSNPTARLKAHCVSERFLGRDITMEILDWVLESERFTAERFAVRVGLWQGYPLENIVWSGNLHRRSDSVKKFLESEPGIGGIHGEI